MGIMQTVDVWLILSQVSYVQDLLERFTEHVPAAANSENLPVDPMIRLHAGGLTTVKHFPCETSGKRNEADRAVKFPGNIPYKELLSALLWLSQRKQSDIT